MPGINTEVPKVVSKEERKPRRPSVKNLVGRGLAIAGVAEASLLGGIHSGVARSASVVDNTSTATATRTVAPSPTATPTPTDTEKQIAAMQTVVAKAVDEAQKQRILKDLQATATAIAETPTATPKPIDTATPGPKLNEAVIAIETVVQSRLDEKTAATARAMPSATPTSSPATPTPVSGGQGQEGGVPWGTVLGGGAILGILGGLAVFRRRILTGTRALAGRGITRVRNMLPHGGGPAAPGPGAGAAGP